MMHRVASPFWYYENLVTSIRINSLEDLKETMNRIELGTPEGFGYAMAVSVILIYLDFSMFSWFLSRFQEMTSGKTNLARIEFEEGRATLYSEAVLGTLVLENSKIPCVNLIYLAIAMFGDDAMKYRATRVAMHYLEILVDKFTSVKDALLPPSNRVNEKQNSEAYIG